MKEHYQSQCGQDKYVDRRIYKGKKGGFFLDIGAHNGKTFSNTYFFEKARGWSGVCVEPIPEVFAELDQNRDCIKVNGCIAKGPGVQKFLRVKGEVVDTEMLSGLMDEYDERHLERIDREIEQYGGSKEEIEVQCYNVNEILEEHGITTVDYVSIDTEGNELSILESIDHKSVKFMVFTIENNYADPAIRAFMEKQGYTYLKQIEQDEVYLHATMKKPLLHQLF
jgi:FkbM family methyltransferase